MDVTTRSHSISESFLGNVARFLAQELLVAHVQPPGVSENSLSASRSLRLWEPPGAHLQEVRAKRPDIRT